jgi:putative peptide zinc metalloprotease protein
MTAIAEPPSGAAGAATSAALRRAEGVELLGAVHGSGYKDGAALVRRDDGQMVQLGSLMYGLLECIDGERGPAELAETMSERLGRSLDEEHVLRLAEKLAAQGLLSGTEHRAPPRRNPLLALRWKVLVTNPRVTRLLTAPFAVLFRPWLMWPALAAFVAVFWFVLIDKGVASATAQAFHSPGLLLLVFALAVASAGFHELGHAAACRYGGATPGGMGVGLYLVWPAFYTDVTDAYRLPRRDRLRVDLGGLYFNAVVAVVTMTVWLVVRADALLLLVALQVLQMIKQLSPVIRADGYHILSDATGVPDLFAHIGPTLRRLLPRHRHEPTALTGRARLLVTLWVLIIVPILLSLSLSAILLLPRLATSAWDSGHQIAAAIPGQAENGQIIDLLASLVRLLALALPVFGSVLVAQRIVRTTGKQAIGWSDGSPARRGILVAATTLIVAGLAWAWWPSGQYQPVRGNEGGTIASLGRLIASPASAVRPVAAPARAELAPGTHLAVAMIPVGGATTQHPALFVISGRNGKPAVAIVSTHTPDPAKTKSPGQSGGGAASTGGSATPTAGSTSSTGVTGSGGTSTTTAPVPVTAFPFTLPSPPRPGDSQALAVGTKDGGVTYDVAYSLVTVKDGQPVGEANTAYALANCNACTTVAVSFQVVLVIGQRHVYGPVNFAGALNGNCPACVTTAFADQIVVTLKSMPSKALLAKLTAVLRELNALPALGAAGTPAAITAEVTSVEQQIDSQLGQSGLETNTGSSSTTPLPQSSTTSTSATTTNAAPTGSTAGTSSTSTTPTTTSTTPPTTTTTTTPSSTTAPQATTTSATTTPTSTTPTPTTTTTPATTGTTSTRSTSGTSDTAAGATTSTTTTAAPSG